MVATVRALKAHSGKYRIVAGKPLPHELLAENPDDVLAGAANLRKQIENVQAARRARRWWRSTRSRPTIASEHEAIREIAARAGRPVRGVHALRRRRPGRRRAGRGGRRGAPTSRATSASSTRPRRACGRRSRPSRPRVYGADGVDYYAAGRQAARHLRAATGSASCRCASPRRTCRSRRDPTLKGAPTGLDAAGPRGARLGRRRVRLPDLRRHADHAGARHRARPPMRIDIDENGEIVGLS